MTTVSWALWAGINVFATSVFSAWRLGFALTPVSISSWRSLVVESLGLGFGFEVQDGAERRRILG